MKKRNVAGGGNEMYNLNWSRSDLTRQKLGTFCEYYAKMSLASYGVSIYTSEVDDHGIDFIAESKRGFLTIGKINSCISVFYIIINYIVCKTRIPERTAD